MSTILNKRCRKIMKDWAANSIAPIPSLQHHMNHHTHNTFSTDTYTVDEIPPLDNWMIPTTKNKEISFSNIRPTELRAYWRRESESETHPPMALSCRFAEKLTKQAWEVFWRTIIPHAAGTPWWRLLLDKLPYQRRLHRQQPEKFPSPICRICLKEEEDDFHFVVGCDRKWKVWEEASKELNLADQCSSKEKVWCIMLLLDRSATKPAGRGSILPLIGLI
jgi:hypothetical protein